MSTLTAATGLSGALSGLSALVPLSLALADLSALPRPIALTTLTGLPALSTLRIGHIDPFVAGEGPPLLEAP